MALDKEAYVAKVANASQLELVVINFEIVLDYLEESRKSIGDLRAFQVNIANAMRGVRELKLSLNMDYEISKCLLTLYMHVDGKLSQYLISEDTEILQEAINILNDIKEGFETIAKEETEKQAVMGNAQQIFSGLTYGKDMNHTEYVDIDVNRGFTV